MRQNSPSTLRSAAVPRKSSPGTPQTADFGPFFVRRANFFALAPTPGRAGRQISRTGRRNIATLKPMTPLLAPKMGPLKPASPLRPKTAPKTPISHPQRRRRFQPHTGTSEQRRSRFQTTRPPRLQHTDTVPVGGGGAWPGDQWAANVTNVVKPTRFTSSLEGLCYKRRQSKPKNHYFQRKSPRIDDVCNNGAESHTKNTLD